MQIQENKKARFEYSIEDTFEAGLVLEGWEVKSLRDKKVNMQDGYIFITNNEAYISNMSIQLNPFAKNDATKSHYTTTRNRKLLLHKQEITKLDGQVRRKGYTLVPLKLYFNKQGIAKLLIGLAVGKKDHDKRQSIKEREWGIQKQRLLKRS